MTNPLIWPPLNVAERAVMFDEGRNLLDVPWRHKGRTTKGVDCIGLVYLTLARTLARCRGQRLPKPRDDYGRTPFNRQLRAGLIDWLGEPIIGDPMPGDIVTISWIGDEHHVAIVVPHPFYGRGLLHADNTAGGVKGPRVVEHGWDPVVWDRRVLEGWRP